MTKQAENSSSVDQSFRQAVLRLAQFDPSCEDEYGNQVLDYLVLDALASYGELQVSGSEIRAAIKSSFKLDFDVAEIRASGRKLADAGMIRFVEKTRESPSSYQILANTAERIEKNLAEMMELENRVMERWTGELQERYAEYEVIASNIELFIERLQSFLLGMLREYGIHTVQFLYPDAAKKEFEISSGVRSRTQSTSDSFLDTVLHLELPRFFRSEDRERRAYIASLLNSSFFLHLIQVDEKCSQLLREVTAGQQLYLDNNILYNLVGLDGPLLLESVHGLLDMATRLGYKLCITTKSLDEFHSSLEWHLQMAEPKPAPLPELARIAVEALGEDSFLTAYWRNVVDTGGSVRDFVTDKSNLKDVLTAHQIEVSAEFREKIDNSERLAKEIHVLRGVAGAGTNESILEHDAFHRLFILRLRGGRRHRHSEAVAWFLTQDSKLPRYDRVARKGRPEVPFCVTTDQWIQMNRPLLTRTSGTDEYEASLQVLVTTPFLRSMLGTTSLESAYQRVMSRIGRYETMSPKLAVQIATDRHFMFTLADESAPADIDAEVDKRIMDLAGQLAETGELEMQLEVQGKIISDMRMELEEMKKGQSSLREEEAELTATLHKARQRQRWWAFAALLAVSVVVIWLRSGALLWRWLDASDCAVFLKLTLQMMAAFLLLPISLRKHWGLWVSLAVASFLAFVGLAALS